MRIAIDAHVHLYPSYETGLLLTSAARQLRAAAPDAEACALCLTERAGHEAFRSLARGTLAATPWTVTRTPDPNALELRSPDGWSLLVVAGRQVVTADRIEVLALGVDLDIADGGATADVIARVRAAGALPVLPWGLGKWMGARGRMVRALVERAAPSDFAVADTYLRPALLSENPILRVARARGLRVLAGTDPLPRHGEEKVAGRFGVLVDGPFDAAAAARSMTRLLADPAVPLSTIGRRCYLVETLLRSR